MRVLGFWALFMVLGAALTFITLSNSRSFLAGSGTVDVLSSGYRTTVPHKRHTVLYLEKTRSTVSETVMSDMTFPGRVEYVTMVAQNRKLKEKIYNPIVEKRRDAENMDLEDYHRTDPVPSSKATIKPKPIAHGSPLGPHIPKPSPPDHPKLDGSP